MSNDSSIDGGRNRAGGGASASPPRRSPEPDISQLTFTSARSAYQPTPDDKTIIQVQKNRVTTESPHGFMGNDPVIFSGYPPNGINPGTVYFVFSGTVEPTSFQITSVAGGSSTININDSGSIFYCATKKTVVHANVDVEILSDFGELDQFVIDGDGLVAHILSDPCLDWNLGGQFLHAVYLAEVLIGKLLERNAVFTVVFFTESRHVWGHPSHRLLRELLRTILKKSARDRASMMQEYRFNLALVDQYRTSCQNFLQRCGKYHKLLCAVEKTLKEIHTRSLKDLASAQDAIVLQQQSEPAARALNYQFAENIASARVTCVNHHLSAQECSRKCTDDHIRAVNAVKELKECIDEAESLSETANQFESSRMPGVLFSVRDDISSCNSSQWNEFLETARPRFVLSTDGRTSGSFTFGPGTSDQAGTFQNWATAHFLRQQAHVLASGLSFVFFDGFKISERSVVGTIIQSLGRVARSLEVASASYVSGAQELLELHSSCILQDDEIDQSLSVIIQDASKSYLQQCQESSSKFTRDLLSQVCEGCVRLNVLVRRVQTVIKENRQRFLLSFRVLSELAGKYAQPYPAGSSDEDVHRVPSIAYCFDPNFDEEEDSDEEEEENENPKDDSAEVGRQQKSVQIPQIIKMFQEALLLLSRAQLESIGAKSSETQCKTALSDLIARIEELDKIILSRKNLAAVSVGVGAASPAATPTSASTPKVDPRDPRSIAAMALARNSAPQPVQLSPQEKVEKCQKQVGIKEKSLTKAQEEGGDVAKAQKNLDDAQADLAKAVANLKKHQEHLGAQTSAMDEQLQKVKEEVQKMREELPGAKTRLEAAQSALTVSIDNCTRAEAVAKFVSFWSSCLSFRPSEYVVEVEVDGKTVVYPDKAYTQFGAIKSQIQVDSSKSVEVQNGLRKCFQKVPNEVDRLTGIIAELKAGHNPETDLDAKTAQKLAKCELALEKLQCESIWSQWQFDYYALQKKARQESEGSRTMQEGNPLSDSQRLASSFCSQFTDHWATWLSICAQLYAEFEEFKSCFSSVSADFVSSENLCGAMITELSCFNVNSALLSRSRVDLDAFMTKFPQFSSSFQVCQVLKSEIASQVCSKPDVWPRIISANGCPSDLMVIFCSSGEKSTLLQKSLEFLRNSPDESQRGDDLLSLSSHVTWQTIFAVAVGRAAKALCGKFANFSKFSFSKWYSTIETSAKAAILAVCVGNNLPLALRSINLASSADIPAGIATHVSFLDMVFAEVVKGFPDRPSSPWNLASAPLIDAFDGRLCAFIMGTGVPSVEFLQDFPEVAKNVAAAWKIACEASEFEWPTLNTGAALQPWETAPISNFSFAREFFPISPVSSFSAILAKRRRAEHGELCVFSSQIPVFKRASRNYFFEKGQAILEAMGLDPDEFKRLNYSDAILELAQQSADALDYVSGIFDFDDDEQGRQDKDKLRRLIMNPPPTDMEHPRESFYVPNVSLPVAPRQCFPLGVLPEMLLNVNISYYQKNKIKIRKRCKCVAGTKDYLGTGENGECPFKSYHNCKCTTSYLTGKISFNRNCPGYVFHPVSKEQLDKKAAKDRQRKAAQDRVSWLGSESSGVTTVVNTRVLYHSFRLSQAYDFVKEYNDWKLLKKRFEDGSIPSAEFNSQCEARMQPAKAGEDQVRDMCKQFPQLAIEMMLYRATKLNEGALTKAHPPERNFNPAASVYSLICSVISMFGPENAVEWEEVRAIFMYYPEIPRQGVPQGTKSTTRLLEVLSQYAERRGLDGQALDAYRKTMIERLYKWRNVFESKEMQQLVPSGEHLPNHFDKVMRDFRYFVGKMFFTYGFHNDLKKLNAQPGDLLWDPTIDWNEEADGWERRGLDPLVTSAVGFQLRHMGHMLTRSDGEKPDRRIKGWIPDRWQSDLLDIVVDEDGKIRMDAGSALVCAPTSAGKTFIALYIIREVCKVFNQRVVYVAPTKALCNEVEARLGLDFPNEIGYFNSTHMKFFQGRWEPNTTPATMASRVDIMGSPGVKSTKILVLEPSCLEELLLSADPDVVAWREQLVYVIFDEVHCLSTNPEWERILAMVSCPFIALSATIGNPQHFLEWLKTVQNESLTGRPIKLVEHKTRYVDLRRHLYLPPVSVPDKYEIITQAKLAVKVICDHTSDLSGNMLKHLHPLCHLTQQSFDAGQISTSLRQEPRDCMQLFDAMSEEITAALADAVAKSNVGDIPVLELAVGAMKGLHPDNFFDFVLSINRWSVVSYENALNSLLMSWSQNAVLKPIAAKTLIRIGNMWLSSEEEVANLQEVSCQKNISGDLESISKHVLNLMCSLHQQDRLPALVFNFDTTMVEALAISTAQALEEAEAKYNQLNAKQLAGNDKRVLERDKKLAKMREQRKTTTDAADTSKKETKDLAKEADEVGEEIDTEGHLDSFTFMRVGGRNDDEIKIAKVKIGNFSGHMKDMLLRCLHRGIGIHHKGLPSKYLHLCEKLFRMGFLRVVFSTDTLAYGINMPCRSVIFAGDSVFLNSVQFQQMAGRAGRRGLDVLGHVIFCALPLHRLHRLVISGVPQMNGKHPELPVLVPKLLKYCQGMRYSRKSTELCQRMAFDPLVHFNSNKTTFLWHMIACGHYLYHAGYVEQTQEGDRLTASGQVLAFAHSMAPCHFAFCNLYESGLLHDMCSDPALNLGQQCRALLLVLVAVFKPLALNPTHLKSRSTSRGQIVLTNLNEPRTDGFLFNIYPHLQRVNEQLQVFERTSLDILQSHASAAADRETNLLKFAAPLSAVDKDFTTPLTEAVYKRGKRLTGRPAKDGLLEKLNAQQKPFKCSSPFVAMSGHGDAFATAAQFVVPHKQYGFAPTPSNNSTDSVKMPCPVWVLATQPSCPPC